MTASEPIHSRFSRGLQVPPLENGDRLTRIEFERRYNAMPRYGHGERSRFCSQALYFTTPSVFATQPALVCRFL